MSKGQEYKAYGSIRKMKTGGACGVILALAMLGMVVSTGSVSADEVSTDKPVAVEKKSEVDVPISHDSLDKAVKEAKEVGVKVEVVAFQDKGVATSETVAEKQTLKARMNQSAKKFRQKMNVLSVIMLRKKLIISQV